MSLLSVSFVQRNCFLSTHNSYNKFMKELNISEHEFFTACDDETLTREKREIQKYRTLKKWIFIITTYFIGIITCFICNLVMDHKLPWFL